MSTLTGQLMFFFCGIIALVSAIVTVTLKNPLRSAVGLLVHIFSLAGLYITLHAHLLAAIQLLVYAGAVVVLFVFVIMLIGPGALDTVRDQRGVMTKTFAAATVVLVAGAIAFQVGETTRPIPVISACPDGAAECAQFGGVDAVGNAIYRDAAVPFELASMLLLVAIIAAISVARNHTPDEKRAKEDPTLPIRPRTADAPPTPAE